MVAARVAAERAAVAEATVVARAGAMVASREAYLTGWQRSRRGFRGRRNREVEAWAAAWAVAAGPRAVAARAAVGARWGRGRHECKGMRLKVARGDQRQLGVHSNHELSRAGCNGAPCRHGVHLLPPLAPRLCASPPP